MGHCAWGVVGLAGVLLLTPVPARALDQSVHHTLTRDGCKAVGGIDTDFCDRVGDEAYNVDRDEWNLAAAHAQPEAGQSRCDAAIAVRERLQTLGLEARYVMEMPAPTSWDIEWLASSLGRALHTIQDNCAHHGVSNPQHAWWSFQDSCEGTKTAPDIQPGVIDCATAETKAVWQAFKAQVVAIRFPVKTLVDTDSEHCGWPRRGDVCAFLSEAATWDGLDVSWNNTIMVSVLRNELTAALASSGVPPVGDYCAGNPDALLPRTLAAAVDTWTAPDWCYKLSVYCIGKADAEDEAPPWAEDQTAPPDSGSSGGCSVGGDGSSDPAWLGLTVLLGLAWRRRRRSVPR
jgi:MYXO-CTERM domain-containing protein